MSEKKRNSTETFSVQWQNSLFQVIAIKVNLVLLFFKSHTSCMELSAERQSETPGTYYLPGFATPNFLTLQFVLLTCCAAPLTFNDMTKRM